ncbi:ATP-dependent nuclease [Agrobacterium sp. NPDC090273]|uniref:ATP-dependent nuclease n=1 Tax=Agrobacterium sp. NPDC090273 TaxID=3363919 RepID=UPI00383B51AA
MHIDTLTFNAGSTEGEPALRISPKRVTVFVGPNNGGKSASLREIHHSITTGRDAGVIFSRIDHSIPELEDLGALLDRFTFRDIPASNPGHVQFGYRGNRQEVNLQFLRERFSMINGRPSDYAYAMVLQHLVLSLGGENRLGMVNGGGAQPLTQKPQSTIAAIFLEDELRKKVSDIVFEAFNQHLVVDPTNMGFLSYVFSDDYPSSEISQSFGRASIEFFSKCSPVVATSDGTKAFVGIMTEVIAGSHDILTIDEPEAFLHPALAYLLGREITRNLADKKQMFVSTHSPHFLMGCISAGLPVDIVRLTYKAKKATARLLPSDQVKRMMYDPLLKSIGVMGALFFESAVVVEADSDRAFYEEINSRLNLFGDEGVRHASFLNAHNKQEAVHIARVLRNIGIPAAIILDLDWIKEDGKVAQRYFAAAGVPVGLRPGLLDTRRRVRASLDAANEQYKTKGGIGLLKGEELETAKSFFDQMAAYGLFTVRNGELENWLPHLGIDVRKDLWLSAMFERLGSNPANEGFVKPAEGDVWQEIRALKNWIQKTDRQGMTYVDPAEL